jgi:hypothetical protein
LDAISDALFSRGADEQQDGTSEPVVHLLVLSACRQENKAAARVPAEPASVIELYEACMLASVRGSVGGLAVERFALCPAGSLR